MVLRTLRTTRITVGLLFFELLSPVAIAAEVKPLDVSGCIKIGKYWICPSFVPPVVLSEEQHEALQKTAPLTVDDIKAATKSLEEMPVPDSKK